MFRATAVLAAGIFSIAATSARAADRPADPSNYVARLRQLTPGDRLILAPGNYDGLQIANLSGEEGRPIIITGPESGAPAIITGDASRNTISFRDSSFIVVRHLQVDNGGLDVDGVKAEGDAAFAHHITLEHLHLHNFGASQQLVGINTKCPTWDWIIRDNIIEDAGTGMYLGNSDGSAPFVRGIVEYNLVVNSIGYNLQVKHQNPRPALAGLPAGDNVTIIRHNVFTKQARASLGGEARPNVLVGHWPLSGPGQNDRYELYGNFFFQNQSGTEALFQGEGNVSFHDNILVNTLGPGINIQPHNDVPKEISIYDNTIYTSGRGISITGGSSQYAQAVVGNAVFSPAPMSGGQPADNITDALGAASGYVRSPTDVLGMMDFYPLPGALEGSRVDLSRFAAHTDYDRDFNGTMKSGTTRGAYSGGAAANPGWLLAESIKGMVLERSDAGVAARDVGFALDTGEHADADPTMPPIDPPDAGLMLRPDPVRGSCACSDTEARGDPYLVLFALALVSLRARRG